MPAACDSVLEDIEDIVSAEDLKPHDRQFVRKNVFPKVRKRNSQKNIQTDDDPPSDSIIPGAQKIWIRTWGCSHNNSDGEYMAGQLAAYGYKITETCAHIVIQEGICHLRDLPFSSLLLMDTQRRKITTNWKHFSKLQ
ncbi:PREDICTED: threonylcarbamoyladenosine tRNA methylthiotransferase-like isoform X1 [Aptenodytes forsteri]|uniref:threonylcarbamoyladenosine tRNA methylthiotransferase-like isoform X1 n=1 Tax=Aptenodytes forsteri TaxID=9233 RepID=UPI0004F43E52|nr:PREDICTED: threonylcarbamoyladenosine tRNA methylthiotransferase-like isoform X1 [Aptenodytes forsteri]